jgi:histidinol dehydrogenase
LIRLRAISFREQFWVRTISSTRRRTSSETLPLLFSTRERVAREAMAHVERLLPGLPTHDFAGPARRDHGRVLVVDGGLKTVTCQEVTSPEAAAALGELCGRTARVEKFEGHARSGDIRVAKVRGTTVD